MLAIDGRSGAGKTSLADAASAATGAPLIHMDDLYAGWSGLAAAPGLLAERVLAPLAAGASGAYRRWDWLAGAWGETVAVPPPAGGVLIVEGCGASVGPAGRYACVRVWLDAPEAVRRDAALSRDGDAFAPHWDHWARQEDALFAADRTRERADIVASVLDLAAHEPPQPTRRLGGVGDGAGRRG